MAKQSRNVFISHVHEDDEGLGELKSLLAKNGMSVRDYSINSANPNNAESESYIKTEILAPRIQDCGTLIVYITPQTKDSDYVNWEIEYAQKEEKRIVGVWAHGEKGCDIPIALADYADAIVGWQGNNIVDAINGAFNGCTDPGGTPFPPRPIKRAEC